MLRENVKKVLDFYMDQLKIADPILHQRIQEQLKTNSNGDAIIQYCIQERIAERNMDFGLVKHTEFYETTIVIHEGIAGPKTHRVSPVLVVSILKAYLELPLEERR